MKLTTTVCRTFLRHYGRIASTLPILHSDSYASSNSPKWGIDGRARLYNITAMKDLEALLKRKTISSLELVELLNALRDKNDSRLRHDHFVTKVPIVLGTRAGRFKDTKTAGYIFPMREACLMVLSYGHKLQAAMFDLMVSIRN